MNKQTGTWRDNRLMRALRSLRTSNQNSMPIGNSFPPQEVIDALKQKRDE